MKLFYIIYFALCFNIIMASPTSSEYLNEAVYTAEVKSFTTDGFLNCEFQCFLDMNYSDFENAPSVFFQIGTAANPTEYKNIKINEKNLVESSFLESNYKLRLNFGKIFVKKDFVARITIVSSDDVKHINLPPTDFDDPITVMDEEKALKESGLCKAEQFLKKIDFDRLYREYSYVQE